MQPATSSSIGVRQNLTTTRGKSEASDAAGEGEKRKGKRDRCASADGASRGTARQITCGTELRLGCEKGQTSACVASCVGQAVNYSTLASVATHSTLGQSNCD